MFLRSSILRVWGAEEKAVKERPVQWRRATEYLKVKEKSIVSIAAKRSRQVKIEN